MKELELFTRQFLLTVQENFNLPWKRKKILNYNLFYHPDLEFEYASNKTIELYLLGFIFDYENPEYTNKQILDSLSNTSSFDNFLEHLFKYSGHFVLIYKSNEKLILLNDAVAQHEIYYDTLFSSFGTQPKLLGRVVPLLPHSSVEAVKFYSSSTFSSKKIFIGETTHAENILHLLPNHYIDITNKKINRFFPINPIIPISIYEASAEARKMLKGYIKAASIRNNLYMGITGGYDSRVLFLASLDLECKYYVTKLSHMDNKHYDIVIPQKLTQIFKKEFKVISERDEIDNNTNQILETSIDFPRNQKRPGKDFINHIILNGNLSEIARNYYGYHKDVSPKDLAFLYKYPKSEFVLQEYEKWIHNGFKFFSEKGYDILDMFYWEEKMGHWASKAKTEMSSLGTIVYSPFCSHKLLITLLSVPRKYRDSHYNKLYNLMIKEFSPGAFRIPINPSLKNSIIKLLKTLKIFNIYQQLVIDIY